jgi:peptidoglycan/LPS O-acetylase OafA/YrhL
MTRKWPGMISHFWSLGVEEQFYFIWPFFILLVKTKHLKLLFGTVIGISLVSKYFFFRDAANYVPIDYTFPINCFDTFGVGALLALFYVNNREKLSGLPWNTLFFILTGIGIWMFYASHFSFLFSTVIALVSVCIIGQCIKGYRGLSGFVLNNTFLRYLGRISYGIYAYHYFMPWIWHNLTGTEIEYPLPALHFIHNPFFTRPLITLVMEGLMLLGIASVSWYFFEKPLNNLKRYFE